MAPEKTEQELIASEGPEEPEAFIYDEHSHGRVKVVPYAQTSKFVPGDRVWYRDSGSGSRQGPFIVVQGPATKEYRLTAIHDVTVFVLGGKVVKESELEEAAV